MFWLKAGFPFQPKKSGFYYGWVILLIAMLASISSIPGQTAGFSPFTEPLLYQLSLTRTELSTCYFIGTLLSSFLLPKVGRWIDHFGVRFILVCNAILFGLLLLWMSFLPSLIQDHFPVSANYRLPVVLTLMTFSILFLRFLGQGTLPLISSTMIGKWFSENRGKASAISSVVVGLAFSASPSVMNELVLWVGARQAWLLCAGFMFIILLPVALIFSRDTPESCGFQVEGKEELREKETSEIEGVGYQEAKKSIVYWAILLPLAIHAMVFTGFTFHLLGISQELKMDSRSAMAIFLPVSLISLPLGFYLSRWSDTHSMRPLIFMMASAQLLGYSSCIFLDYTITYSLAIIGIGLTSAAFSPLFSIAMAKYFGRRYLGELQGKLSSAMVMASSIGPLTLSIFQDIFQSFKPGLFFFSLLPLSVLLLLWGKKKEF